MGKILRHTVLCQSEFVFTITILTARGDTPISLCGKLANMPANVLASAPVQKECGGSAHIVERISGILVSQPVWISRQGYIVGKLNSLG